MGGGGWCHSLEIKLDDNHPTSGSSQPIDEAMFQLINQPTYRSSSQPKTNPTTERPTISVQLSINQSTNNQSINQPIIQPIKSTMFTNQPTNQCVHRATYGRATLIGGRTTQGKRRGHPAAPHRPHPRQLLHLPDQPPILGGHVHQ